MKLDANIPSGPIAEKWDRHRFNTKLVNPANKRKYTVIVVGPGLAGGSAAASSAGVLGSAATASHERRHTPGDGKSLEAVGQAARQDRARTRQGMLRSKPLDVGVQFVELNHESFQVSIPSGHIRPPLRKTSINNLIINLPQCDAG